MRREQQHGIGGARHGWPPSVASGPSITQSSISASGSCAWVRAWQREAAAPVCVVALQGAGGRARKASRTQGNSRFGLQSYEDGPWAVFQSRDPESMPLLPCGGARSCPPGPEGNRTPQRPPRSSAGIRASPATPINRMRVLFSPAALSSAAHHSNAGNPEIASPSQQSQAWHSQSTEAQRERNRKCSTTGQSFPLASLLGLGCSRAASSMAPAPVESSTNCSCRLGNGTIGWARRRKLEFFANNGIVASRVWDGSGPASCPAGPFLTA